MECFSYLRNVHDLSSGGKNSTRETFWETVYVHDVELSRHDDTPAVLSFGQLCEEHGYTCGWASGKSHEDSMQDSNVRHRCCSRILVKLKRKFVFCIVPAGLIEYLSESSKFTK